MPEEEEEEIVPSVQEIEVYMWRFSQLWDAGYDSVVAELLAETDHDLHQMCEAKKAGLSDRQARLIYL
jgi:hypothetical protein